MGFKVRTPSRRNRRTTAKKRTKTKKRSEGKMAILKFEPNTPEQVQLKFASGKPHGNSMMYSLTDGRVMFLPQFADKQILALQARAGDRFEITKNVLDGKVRWNVQRITETKPTPKPMAQANGHAQPAAQLLNAAENLDLPDVDP